MPKGNDDNSETTLPDKQLTERQHQVLELLASGLSDKQIGTRLNISEHTVGEHVRHIFRKTGAKNRVQAAHLLARHHRDSDAAP